MSPADEMLAAGARSVTREVRRRFDCRLCGSRRLETIWSFGQTPLANAYVAPDRLKKAEISAPLTVNFCKNCKLVQLQDVVDPKILFGNYLYVSSTSPSFVAHFESYANHIRERFRLKSGSLVADVGSNDGVLLKFLQREHIRVVGVDPAANIVVQANADGVPTEHAFFTPSVAHRLRRKWGPADVITANNVFAHTDDVRRFTAAVRKWLSKNGVFVFEVQYLKDLLEKNLFDMVYHEHLCYYHLTPLEAFFEKETMEIFDVEHVPVHGGSIRVYVQKSGGPHRRSRRLDHILKAEHPLNTLRLYRQFAGRVERNGVRMRKLLSQVKKSGARIAGYGAPAKATTLICVFGIADKLDYIVEDAPLKQGCLMPGTHIPILGPEKLYTDKPDYCLILAWNFAKSIIKNHASFAAQGGKFIVPMPIPRII